MPQPEAGQVGQVQRPLTLWGVGFATGAGLGDMQQGVGPAVTKGVGIGAGANTKRVEHQQQCPAHEASINNCTINGEALSVCSVMV